MMWHFAVRQRYIAEVSDTTGDAMKCGSLGKKKSTIISNLFINLYS